jgi:hypothetical protein
LTRAIAVVLEGGNRDQFIGFGHGCFLVEWVRPIGRNPPKPRIGGLRFANLPYKVVNELSESVDDFWNEPI